MKYRSQELADHADTMEVLKRVSFDEVIEVDVMTLKLG